LRSDTPRVCCYSCIGRCGNETCTVPRLFLYMKVNGTVQKPNIRLCQVNNSINYPALRKLVGKCLQFKLVLMATDRIVMRTVII